MYAIDELRQAGFKVWTESEKIRYKQVNEGPVDEVWINKLLQNIKEHKQEALKYLKDLEITTSKKDPVGPVPILDLLTFNPDFSRAGLVVKLHSDLLNEDFFLVSDTKLKAKVEAENPGTVVYLPGEIERLAGIGPEEAKRLHMVKKAFPGGELIGVGNVEDSVFSRSA